MTVELFASKTCPYCAQVRERFEWDGTEYIEHDVDADAGARARLIELLGPNAIVPAVIESGRITEVGVDGRGCYVGNR